MNFYRILQMYDCQTFIQRNLIINVIIYLIIKIIIVIKKMKNTPKKISNPDKQIDNRYINSIFQEQYHAQIFFSRCQDTGEKPDLEKAKMFKESLNKLNSKKFPHILNLNSMRLGVNTIMKLISILQINQFSQLNLADNSISEYGMHAIKNLISSTKLQDINLASNMISEVGLSLILEELIKNIHLKQINLGIQQGSIRKNSFGIDGARCLAAVLLQNKSIETLILQDNDIGINGAQILSIPLKKNKQLKYLTISQNMIKTQGAQYLLLNAIHLESLDIGKNFIKSSIGPTLRKYVQINKNLRKINLQFNELLGQGVQTLFQGAITSLIEDINLRGNGIGDRGIFLLQNIFNFMNRNMQNLKYLNLSANEISSAGIKPLITIINFTKLKNLCLSKNLLGDDGIIQLINFFIESPAGEIIQRLQFSGCKISDKGFMHIMENINLLGELKYLKCSDNYISEKYQKIYIDLLQKNYMLLQMAMSGNRISLSGLKGIKKIIDRNLKAFEQRQPKKMKSEVINLKQKQKKIKQAQERIQKQKKQISRLQQTKTKLNDNISRLQKEQKERRQQFQEMVKRRTDQIQQIIKSTQSKVEKLSNIKQQKQQNIEQLSNELTKLRDKRKQLQYELTVAQNQQVMIQRQYQKKMKKIRVLDPN